MALIYIVGGCSDTTEPWSHKVLCTIAATKHIYPTINPIEALESLEQYT